jgi:hypothetical protein
VGIILSDLEELFPRVGIGERVEKGDTTVEGFLRVGGAGGEERNLAELSRYGVPVLFLRQRKDMNREEREDRQNAVEK